METLLQALANPGDMSGQQWLLVLIMLLVLVGCLWFAWYLYRTIEAERRNRYVPNIGRKRLQEKGGSAPGTGAADKGSETPEP